MTPSRKLTTEQQQMVVDYMPAAEAFVLKRYTPHNEHIREELFSAAYEGLTRGALAYEDKGLEPWTYLRYWVFKVTQEHLAKNHTIRPPWSDIKSGKRTESFEMEPLDRIDEDDESKDFLQTIGVEEEGYAEVEEEMMKTWLIEKVFPHYSQRTIDHWFSWKEGRKPLPTEQEDEDLRACILILDDEVREGVEG